MQFRSENLRPIDESNSQEAVNLDSTYRLCLFNLYSSNSIKELQLSIGIYKKKYVISIDYRGLNKTDLKESFECPTGGSEIRERTWHSVVFTYSTKDDV